MLWNSGELFHENKENFLENSEAVRIRNAPRSKDLGKFLQRIWENRSTELGKDSSAEFERIPLCVSWEIPCEFLKKSSTDIEKRITFKNLEGFVFWISENYFLEIGWIPLYGIRENSFPLFKGFFLRNLREFSRTNTTSMFEFFGIRENSLTDFKKFSFRNLEELFWEN